MPDKQTRQSGTNASTEMSLPYEDTVVPLSLEKKIEKGPSMESSAWSKVYQITGAVGIDSLDRSLKQEPIESQ